MPPHVLHCWSYGQGRWRGHQLAMAQAKASPVPAPEPMFRVSAVLRRYDADVPLTAVGACCRRRLGPACAFSTGIFAAAALTTQRGKTHPGLGCTPFSLNLSRVDAQNKYWAKLHRGWMHFGCTRNQFRIEAAMQKANVLKVGIEPRSDGSENPACYQND
jgi:hypothetical protein